MIKPPDGTVTFLFADIEGSTRLWESHPDEMRGAVAQHDALLRSVFAENRGYVFKTTGDGFAVAFAVAADAMNAALDAQRALSEVSWPGAVVIRSRIGLHTGTAELRDHDYFGATLNRCARLMAAGHGGQVLLSAATQELCRDALPPQVSLLHLGEYRLKDLTRPESVSQLVIPGHQTSFPPLRTLDNPTLPNNLPQQLTSFVGRDDTMIEARALLSGTRLLTLAGSGGSGKTRLSLQLAADVLDNFADGVWQVELAALTDPDLVPQTVAAVLGVREAPGKALSVTLADSLQNKQLLLLLDNAEHLIAACASLVAALLRSCPRLKILVTSREPIGIAGEQIFRVPPLSLPTKRQAAVATVDSLSQFEAVRLFIDRALLVQSEFKVTNESAPSLAQLCVHLDGIPLAIELAAARVRSLTVVQINERLDSRFRLLTGGDRSALPRQQTLRALVDWSYDLLSEDEKRLLARLSIFTGGSTLDAAERVCGYAPLDDWQIMDVLTGLADKSLLQLDADIGGQRNRMLESIREYAHERLAASGEGDVVQARHRDWCVALAEESATKLTGPEQVAWLNRLEAEHDNLRACLALTSNARASHPHDDRETNAVAGLRVAKSLGQFWQMRGYLSEARAHLDDALRFAETSFPEDDTVNPESGHSSTPGLQKAIAGARHSAGILAQDQGDYDTATMLLEKALVFFRQKGEPRNVASALNNLGNVAWRRGDYEGSKSRYEECLALQREHGDKNVIANVLMNLGSLAATQGDYRSAQPFADECLAIFRTIGNRAGISSALTVAGNIAWKLDDRDKARGIYEESLAICREIGTKTGIAIALSNLAPVFADTIDGAEKARALFQESLTLYAETGDKRGAAITLGGLAELASMQADHRQAVILRAASQAIHDSIGSRRASDEQKKFDEALTQARAALGDVPFSESWAAGLALSWDEVLELTIR